MHVYWWRRDIQWPLVALIPLILPESCPECTTYLDVFTGVQFLNGVYIADLLNHCPVYLCVYHASAFQPIIQKCLSSHTYGSQAA